jgi:quercetin dioxygenase-like cupin family protein
MGVELDEGHPDLVPPGAGEVVFETETSRAEILSDRESVNVTLFHFRSEGGPALHVHRRHADAFYVLEGELTVPLGPDGEAEQLPAGSFVLAPPLVAHAFRNDSGTDVRFLNFHAPGEGFVQMLRLPAGERPPFDQEPPPPDGGRSRADAQFGLGELLVDRSDLRVALLADEEHLGVCEVTSAPGRPSPPAHVHRRHSESFYVLEGEIAFTLGTRELVAGPGTWAHVPAGVPHTFALRGEVGARFLDLHAPSCGFGDFVRALHAAKDEEELAQARARFDQEPA